MRDCGVKSLFRYNSVGVLLEKQVVVCGMCENVDLGVISCCCVVIYGVDVRLLWPERYKIHGGFSLKRLKR